MNLLIVCAVFLPMLAAPVGYKIGLKNKPARNWFTFLISLIACAAALFCAGSLKIDNVLVLGISFCVTPLQKTLAVLTGIVWTGSELFSQSYMEHEHGSNRYHLFSFLTLGATMGVFLSGDLYTLFIFFEIMSFTSYVIVKQTQEQKALAAAQTYLAIAVSCGMLCLMGIFMLYNEFGTLDFRLLLSADRAIGGAKVFTACVLTLIGFGAKAGMFPVHVWLPQTHPAAPAPFSAILSCILTKTGVFGVLAVTSFIMRFDHNWGMLLLVLGCITMALGAVLALLSVDLKRTLACSSLSQIGFILTGIAVQTLLGSEGALSMDGTLTHIVNHSLIKLVLFTAAGMIFMDRETLDLNELKGAGRGNLPLMAAFLLAAASISGIPGLGGYISKTLLHEGIVEYGRIPAAEWVFIISGGFTLAYMTKLFVCLFVEKGSVPAVKNSSKALIVMLPIALIMPIFGIVPSGTLGALAAWARPFMGGGNEPLNVDYYSLGNLLGAFKSIVIGTLTYLLIVRKLLMRDGVYIDRLPRWLSLENKVYRPLTITLLPVVGSLIAVVPDKLADSVVGWLKKAFFNRNDAVIVPKEDRYFGRYADEPFLRRGFSDTLAYGFMILGLCVTISLIYIIIRSL